MNKIYKNILFIFLFVVALFLSYNYIIILANESSYNKMIEKINMNNTSVVKDIDKEDLIKYLYIDYKLEKQKEMKLKEDIEQIKIIIDKEIYLKDNDKEYKEQQEEVLKLKEKIRKKQENKQKKTISSNKKHIKEQTINIEGNSVYNGNLLNSTSLSSNDINNFLKNSNMSGLGEIFKNVEEKTGVNAAFLTALAINESNWGKSKIAQDKNNLFGYGAYNHDPYNSAYHFKDIEDGVLYVAMKLRMNYLTKDGPYFNGYRVEDVNVRYSKTDDGDVNYNWSKTILKLINQMSK